MNTEVAPSDPPLFAINDLAGIVGVSPEEAYIVICTRWPDEPEVFQLAGNPQVEQFCFGESVFVKLLQHYGLLPPGSGHGFWLRTEIMATIVDRSKPAVSLLIDNEWEEAYERRHEGHRRGLGTRFYQTASLVRVLRHYNFIPSAEYVEFSIDVPGITAILLEEGLIRSASLETAIITVRTLLVGYPHEQRRVHQPSLKTRTQLHYQPAIVLPWLKKKLRRA